MTEDELKKIAAELAEKLKGVDGIENVEFMADDKLEGEPASICLEFGDHSLALGVLPL